MRNLILLCALCLFAACTSGPPETATIDDRDPVTLENVMRTQRSFNAYTWPAGSPDEGKVDIRLGPTVGVSGYPTTGDRVTFNEVVYYYHVLSPTGPDELVVALTNGETTYTAPQAIADTDAVSGFTGVTQVTLLGVVHATRGRLKANS